MANQIKQLSKHSIIFGIGDLLRGIAGFLLLPIYTRYLIPADYGRLELLNITLNILLIITTQEIGTAFFRTYAFADKDSKKSITELVSTSYLYMAFSGLFISIILFLCSDKYSQLVFGEHNSSNILIKILACTLFFAAINSIPFQLLRAELESLKYVSISILGFLTQCIFNIIFVVMLEMNIKGILLGNAIASSLITFMGYFVLKKHLILKISKPLLKDLLSFGYPLILSGLSLWVLQMSDRFLIQKLASASEVGLYSMAARFSNVLTLLIITPFQVAWGAYSFQIAVKDEGKKVISEIATYFFFLLSFFGFLIILWTPVVIKLIAEKSYWVAHKVVLPLVFTNILWGAFLIFIFGLYFVKGTKLIPVIVLLGAVVNVSLNFIVIPKFGMFGAAYSAVLSYFIMAILSYKISQRVFYIPFDKIRLLKIMIIFVIFSILSQVNLFINVAVDVSYRIILMVCFITSFI